MINTYTYLFRVIKSCQTYEQLSIAMDWVAKVIERGGVWDKYHYSEIALEFYKLKLLEMRRNGRLSIAQDP